MLTFVHSDFQRVQNGFPSPCLPGPTVCKHTPEPHAGCLSLQTLLGRVRLQYLISPSGPPRIIVLCGYKCLVVKRGVQSVDIHSLSP